MRERAAGRGGGRGDSRLHWPQVCRKAGIPLLLAPSIKAGLDLDWSNPKQKAAAIQILERQVSSLQQWVDRHLDDVIEQPIRPYLDAVTQVRDQDLELEIVFNRFGTLDVEPAGGVGGVSARAHQIIRPASRSAPRRSAQSGRTRSTRCQNIAPWCGSRRCTSS
ncbi:uncharacterized protein SOCEGT47_025890 [Sorangium cellulosum]|uniref:Uncharacterized protein n=1 Tax=Sorangium cellulosum TaxID=56 RepID=A0A4P2PZN3_SORCE|nr:uncharacterized protein SOCEGT47_025890 [Sorangium cellulosum]